MEIVLESLFDTLKLIPFLAIIYMLVGFLEYRYGDRMGVFITRFGIFGPVLGAIFGCIPQCGFSVVAAALYARGVITRGTLLSVFLSTSDEAVPVLLSMPDKVSLVGMLIGIKIVIAIIAGTAVDLVMGSRPVAGTSAAAGADAPCDSAHGHCGCCSHDLPGEKSIVRALLVHPAIHTAKIFGYLLALTLALNALIGIIGEARLSALFLRGSVFQPIVAALIGLIPSCFASVLLAELFAKGAIAFGSMMAGLCAAAGLGLLVLIKENKSRRDTIVVVGLLLAISIAVGVCINFY